MYIYSFIIPILVIMFIFYKRKRVSYRSEIGTILLLIKKIHIFVLVFIFILIFIITVASNFNFINDSLQELMVTLLKVSLYGVVFLVIRTDYYFISDTGIGMMNSIKRVSYFIEWKDISLWHIEKCFNSDNYSYCICLKDNSEKHCWLLNRKYKESVEQITTKYINDKRQFY